MMKTRILAALTATTMAFTAFSVPSTSAQAAYTENLQISAPESVSVKTGQSQTIKFTFSGLGISGLAFATSGDVDVSWHDAYWTYPGECHIYADVTLNSGSSGKVTLYLRDEDGGYPASFSTKLVAKQTEVWFENFKFPSQISNGKGQHIFGTITSTDKIDSVTAEVYCQGNVVMSAVDYPDSTQQYSLYNSSLDWNLTFGKLGYNTEYTLVYTVQSGGKSFRSSEYSFTVGSIGDVDTSDFERTLYDLAKSQVGKTYVTYVPWKTKTPPAWCGYFSRWVEEQALEKIGYSESEAKQMIGWKYLTGACTADYAYETYDFGNLYDFGSFDITWDSPTVGKTITAQGKNTYSSSTFTPKVGSYVLINTNSSIADGPDHIGIIIQVNDDNSFTVAEGNTGAGSSSTRTVKIYKYEKVTYKSGTETIRSWHRTGCSGSMTLVLGICEPSFLNG